MRKRRRFLGMIFLVLFSSASFIPDAYASTMWSKFGRGVNNIIFGWVEVFYQPVVMHEEEGEIWPIAVAGGMLRGIGYAVARTGVGLYETLTFPCPGPHQYEPIMLPEHIVPAARSPEST